MTNRPVVIVVGARPNFIKITQFPHLFIQHNIPYKIIHTGQHYDKAMSDVFFSEFGFYPDIFLGVIEESPIAMISEIMKKLERVLLEINPSLVVVVGDVNSTLAGALTANRIGLPLAHIESGLRSFDTSMPEEWNRILTDRMSDLLFVSEPSGLENLRKEGIKEDRIFFVGNTLIDALVAFLPKINECKICSEMTLEPENYIVITLHRPSNVDSKDKLSKYIRIIKDVAGECRVVFPVHPRTLKNLERFNLMDELNGKDYVKLCEPLPYIEFIALVKNSLCVITDSGGIQEETTFLNKPCLTLRTNTERPITITWGTNELIPPSSECILQAIKKIKKNQWKKCESPPPLWDGMASLRITKIIKNFLN